ncbi:MucBP domain-containing protein [Furfurilactobacillus sp. WILCCON 0119]
MLMLVKRFIELWKNRVKLGALSLAVCGIVGGLAFSPPMQGQANSSNAKNEIIKVTKENFLEYFSVNGDASYNNSNGIVTLTQDKGDQTGNFSLKNRIDLSKNFTIKGRINLGSNSGNEGGGGKTGADGIGFAFHPGNTSDVGYRGANMGIGGLQNAIGFQLDTYLNGYSAPDPSAQYNNQRLGWEADPRINPYGAFVTTDGDKGWATIDTQSVQGFNRKSNVDGQFQDVSAQYNGKTRELTITYDSADGELTWTRKIPESELYEQVAMVISASTGGYSNLQQFQFESFEFEPWVGIHVRHVVRDDNGFREISESDSLTGQIGDEYEAQEKNLHGFKFVETDESGLAKKGVFPEKGGTVILVYEAQKQPSGKVMVIHQTEDGEVLKREEATYPDGRYIDKEYYTSEGSFKGYEISGIEGWSPTGRLREEDGEVIYRYRKLKQNAGSVTVHHVNEQGKQLAETTKATYPSGQYVGESYTTTDIMIDGYTYSHVDTSGEGQSPAIGLLEEKPQDVYYVYNRSDRAGNVIAHYEDEQGEQLTDPVEANYINGQYIGEPYETEEKNFENYTFKQMKAGSATASGELTADDQHVTYVYERADHAGRVTVHHETVDGKELAEPQEVKPELPFVGESYTTQRKEISGYSFVKVDEDKGAPAEGKLTTEDIDVYYIYAPKDASGTITVHHQTATGMELSPTNEATYPNGKYVGDAYETKPKEINDYHFVKVDVEKGLSANGTLTANNGDIYYIYARNSGNEEVAGKVIAKYMTDDEEPKELFSEEATYPDGLIIDGRYQTSKYQFEGYEFKETTGWNPSGYLTEADGIVTYVYKKVSSIQVGKVMVTHETIDGNELATNEAQYPNGQKLGEAYIAEPRDFTGLELKYTRSDSAPASGVLSETDQHVIFVYGPPDTVETPSVQVEHRSRADNLLLGVEEATYPDGQEVDKPYETKAGNFEGYQHCGMGEGLSASGVIPAGGGIVTYLYDATTIPAPEPDPDPIEPEPAPLPESKPDPDPMPDKENEYGNSSNSVDQVNDVFTEFAEDSMDRGNLFVNGGIANEFTDTSGKKNAQRTESKTQSVDEAATSKQTNKLKKSELPLTGHQVRRYVTAGITILVIFSIITGYFIKHRQHKD